jgi:VanZ family protein
MIERTNKRGRVWGSRVALGFALGVIGWMSLRPVGDAPLDQAVHALGNGYLHLPAYALLAALFVLVLGRYRRRILLAGVAATAYGWALEVAQLAVPTRHFNLLGLGFDAAGATFACLAILALCSVARHPRSGSARREKKR